ncbi:MAG: hypothetical protein HUU32_22220 [Calditrichaceae bacterium]|nr:hypothetical protein [Calditrichia bacterium]NUQ44109.1 hypothetical protein [Calditrichaceae bacterium]
MSFIGKLFVFEGADGVGKSTVSQLVAERLSNNGNSCLYLSFPGKEEGTLGNLVYQIHHDQKRFNIDSIVPASLQVLHIAAHIDAIEKKIIPAIKEGKIILLDRFWWSTLVYGKVYGVNYKSLKSMIELEKVHWGKLKPTIAFLITRETSLRENTDLTTWTKLNKEYEKLTKKESKQYKILEISNNGDINFTVNAIVEEINKVETILPSISKQSVPFVFTSLAPAQTTEVYDTYWRFATERQAIFFRKMENHLYPLTKDPILANYKFTNAYRASDRVSQYLIKNVIYKGQQSPEEIFFRILLFKTFNRIETWEYLTERMGSISYSEYSFKLYDQLLSKAMSNGKSIFSAAYIMTSGQSSFGYPRKHQNHLKLLELLMEDEIPNRITELKSMKELFELLRSYPTIGDFLAYQYTIDINYSELTNFTENEFVEPGPGAKDGIRKCFSDLGGLNEVEIIKQVTERQELEFERLGLNFQTLWGRPLHLIDCQNLFCEVDKYARIAHPEIKGISDRKRIKQRYFPRNQEIGYWYPPKWGINHLIKSEGGN